MQQLKIKILDNEYTLKSDEDVEQVYRIAEYVNDKLKEVKENTEGLSDNKTAILVALNIASDYFQLKKEREEELGHIRRKTETLIQNIEAAGG